MTDVRFGLLWTRSMYWSRNAIHVVRSPLNVGNCNASNFNEILGALLPPAPTSCSLSSLRRTYAGIEDSLARKADGDAWSGSMADAFAEISVMLLVCGGFGSDAMCGTGMSTACSSLWIAVVSTGLCSKVCANAAPICFSNSVARRNLVGLMRAVVKFSSDTVAASALLVALPDATEIGLEVCAFS